MNAAQAPHLTAELAARGYDREALAKIWGGNFLRLLRQAEALKGELKEALLFVNKKKQKNFVTLGLWRCTATVPE